MKHQFLRIVLLAAAGSLAVSAFAESLTSIVFPPKGFSIFDDSLPVSGSRIALGDSRKAVKKSLGTPSKNLSPNHWLYENVKVTFPGKAEPFHGNLYVVFSGGKIVDLAVVSERKRHELIAEAKLRITVTAAD